MKNIGLTIIIVATVSTSALAKESGLRVGLGYTKATSDQIVDELNEASGFAVEVGYEFNEIIGISTRYSQTETDSTRNFMLTDLSMRSIGAYADVGYMFGNKEFKIKPYGLGGFEALNFDLKQTGWSYSGSDSASQTALVIGVGARATINEHFIVTAEYRVSTFELDYGRYGTEMIDIESITMMAGYRF